MAACSKDGTLDAESSTGPCNLTIAQNVNLNDDMEGGSTRPDSLDVGTPVCTIRPSVESTEGGQSESFSPNLKGTFTRKGEITEFVADDIQAIIKKSKDSVSSYGSRGSSRNSLSSLTSMATSHSSLSRSPSSILQHSPDDIPPIDPVALNDLEKRAKVVADQMDLMMGNLKSNLHKMSAITTGCVDAYKQSVDFTCDSVDAAIKSMYTLMARCEEISKSMVPVYKLATEIKEIKRLLILLETTMEKST